MRLWPPVLVALLLLGAALQPSASGWTRATTASLQPIIPDAVPDHPAPPGGDPGPPETPLAVAPGADPGALWEQGRQLERRGSFAAAARLYAAMADRLGADVAPRALFLQARALIDDGDPAAADAALDRLLTTYPASDAVPGALFLRARARRAAGDCQGALDALAAYEARVGASALGPYLALQRARCYAALEQPDQALAAAKAALATGGGGPRLARIDALEQAAQASEQLGRLEDALAYLDRAMALAATRSYRAELLYKTAGLARELGREALARDRFRAVVVEYPEQPRAAAALDALQEMNLADTVSPYQAGLVRLNAGDYGAAMELFDAVDPSSPDAGAAGFNRAIARLRMGEEAAAVDELRAVAEDYPSQAGVALLRAGRLLESEGLYAEAAASYRRLLELAPGSPQATLALLRLGLTRYLRDDAAGAVDAWQTALEPARGATTEQRAEAWFWSGKALARLHGAASAEARDAWTRAQVAAPDSYYGLRAEELLADGGSPVSRPASEASVTLGLTEAEQQQRDGWIDSLGTTTQSAMAGVAANPAVARAEALLDLGLRSEAGWELEAVLSSYAAGKDLPHLVALGRWLEERDLPQLTLRAGSQESALLGQALFDLPAAVQKQLYPAGWGDLMVEQAGRRGVDPLLLMALVKQESAFNAQARSGAQALGLTQVIPSTAADIARRLGRSGSFRTTDLFKPAVSLEFGAYYLAGLLRDYEGRILPALAAYNAGSANANRWLARWGDDPDVFVAEIPFAETQHYVEVVYRNYRVYLHLFSG